MAQKGHRRKKLTQIRVLEGDPKLGKAELERMRSAPAVLEPGEPDMPTWVTGTAAAEWRRLAPLLARMGVLTEADRDVLGMYCTMLAEYQLAATEGRTSVMVSLGVQIRIAAGEFGMTPAGRENLKIQTGKKSPLPVDGKSASRLLGGNG